MASGVAALSLDLIEKAAPVIVAALAPEVQALLAKVIPTGAVKVVPPTGIDVEAAVAANLLKALPAFSGTIYSTIKSKIGIAVAIYATEHPGDNLQGDAAWMDIQSLALRAIADEALDTSRIPLSTLRQMVSSGIELYRAGAGTKALSIGK
jgi:hypothetical protein